MQFEFSNELPIYEQIAEYIVIEIVTGKYAEDRILSVRDYSLKFGVNPNTVQRAMAYLEQSGILFSKRGEGRFIGDKNKAEDFYNRLAMQKCERFLQNMKKMGFSSERVFEVLKEVDYE